MSHVLHPRAGRIPIGVGILSYANWERIVDRYGTVFVMPDNDERDPRSIIYPGPELPASGVKGKLVATVLRANKPSPWGGDWARGIPAKRVKRGQKILFGRGRFFHEWDERIGLLVGVKPVTKRKYDWLNPKAVHRAAGHLVRLDFVCDG